MVRLDRKSIFILYSNLFNLLQMYLQWVPIIGMTIFTRSTARKLAWLSENANKQGPCYIISLISTTRYVSSTTSTKIIKTTTYVIHFPFSSQEGIMRFWRRVNDAPCSYPSMNAPQRDINSETPWEYWMCERRDLTWFHIHTTVKLWSCLGNMVTRLFEFDSNMRKERARMCVYNGHL